MWSLVAGEGGVTVAVGSTVISGVTGEMVGGAAVDCTSGEPTLAPGALHAAVITISITTNIECNL
jgi:hypothetical protein